MGTSARRRTRFVMALLVMTAPLLSATGAAASPVTATVNYSFNRTAPLPWGWTYATAKGCTDPSNVWLANGVLVLRVGQVGKVQYCGGRIETKRTFNPPFSISIRARFALPAGMWPSAVLYGADGDPWPANGEIDLVELISRTPTTDHERTWAAAAVPTAPYRCGDQADPTGIDLTAWHVYTADIGTDSATFSIDGVPFHTTTIADMAALGCTWPYNQPAGLRLFLAAATGGWGGTPGGPGYPAYERFDYVKITPLPST